MNLRDNPDVVPVDVSRLRDMVSTGRLRHYTALFAAMAEHKILLAFLRRNGPAFARPEYDRGWCLIVGDDLQDAKGPSAFHSDSLADWFGGATAVAVHSGAANAAVYAGAALMASCDAGVIIVETQLSHQGEWAKPAEKLAQDAAYLDVTPVGGVA